MNYSRFPGIEMGIFEVGYSEHCIQYDFAFYPVHPFSVNTLTLSVKTLSFFLLQWMTGRHPPPILFLLAAVSTLIHPQQH